MEKYIEIELPQETEKKIEDLAKELGLTKEEVVERAMDLMFEHINSGEFKSANPTQE